MSKNHPSPAWGTLTSEKAVKIMQWFNDAHCDAIPQTNYDVTFMRSLKVLSATIQTPSTPAKAVFRFRVPPNVGNQPTGKQTQTTHGGALGMFFDLPTSLTIVACNFAGWESMGMTRRLDVTFLRPPVEGDAVLIESEVVQIGKRLAVIRGVMKRERDGVMLATCQHDKYMGDVPHYTLDKPLPKL
jgi:acyl-coenzyme A thioesterase 13